MTLDEAIRHAEEVAEYDCYNDEQKKCADEHRQLAEWLRELKRLRESATDTDTISRQAAIDALFELYEYQRAIDPTEAADLVRQGIYLAEKKIEQLPCAKGMTFEEIAQLLSDLCGECACDVNGNDEWLPQVCKYADTECPQPKEKNGCWMQFLMQGGADMRGGES